MRNNLLLAIAVVLVATPVAAQTPKRGGILSHYVTNEPANLDCHQLGSTFLQGLVKPVYSNLVRFNWHNYPAIISDLAQSWTVSGDGLTYTFKLQTNAKFHDGAPFTSADIKATFDRLRNPPPGIVSVRRADFVDVTEISAPDPATVVFRLSQPNAALLDLIADPYNCVYSSRKLAQNQKYPESEPMGTGPFMFTNYAKGSVAEGKRFDGYFMPGLPYLDGYRTYVMSETAAVGQLQLAQIDISIRGLPPQIRETLKQNLGDKIVIQTIPNTAPFVVTFNLKRKPFDDVRVRRALSMAIDRRGVESMKKISSLASWGGFLRPEFDLALPKTETDKLLGVDQSIDAARAEAKRLLAEAGQSNLKVRLLNQDTGTYLTLGPLLISGWKALGIDAEQEIKNAAVYSQSRGSSDFDVAIEPNAAASDDPIAMLAKFMPGSGGNFGGIDDPAIADLFKQQKVALDRGQRKLIVNALERRMLEQLYVAPLFWAENAPAFQRYVKNWQVTPLLAGGYDLTDVWLDK